MHTEPARVLVVLVLYRRAPQEAASWSFLCAALQATADADGLCVAHCLIYDNSPTASAATATATVVPQGVTYHSNPANGGTAAAYAAGVTLAKTQGCTWLLLLDQDTLLPSGYIKSANAAFEKQASPPPVVLIPQTVHQGEVVSPARISRFGSVIPERASKAGSGIQTAISSGLLIRVDAMEQHLPRNPVFWLDYLDHMIFLGLSRSGGHRVCMDMKIGHHLSVQDPTSLSAVRLASILAAERAFCQALGPVASAMLPVRRLRRAMRYLTRNPALSLMLLRSAFV
jgi:GT2 family glycosyltransferase